MLGELKSHPSAEASWPAERVRPAVPRGPESTPRDVQQLWLALERRPWRTLVLVPADGAAAGRAAALAAALGAAGEGGGAGPVEALLAGDLDLPAARECLARIGAPGRRVIVAINSVHDCPAGLMLTQGADAVLLCVALGETETARAERTVELVGRERLVGAVALDGNGGGAP